ncbi:hypothetical protein SNEBB_006701 [Seison nebaliae]|nr:hypothetical protein SNEBB_006701 [Seison nebaliae]
MANGDTVISLDRISLSFMIDGKVVEFKKQYPSNITVGEMKMKMEPIVGCAAQDIVMKLYRKQGDGKQYMADLNENDRLMTSFSTNLHNLLIRITPHNPIVPVISDVKEDFQRIEIDEEKYANRKDNARKFIEQSKKLNNWKSPYYEQVRIEEATYNEFLKNDIIDKRCQVRVSSLEHRGLVKFLG